MPRTARDASDFLFGAFVFLAVSAVVLVAAYWLIGWVRYINHFLECIRVCGLFGVEGPRPFCPSCGDPSFPFPTYRSSP